MPYYMQQPSGELIGPLQIPVAPGHGPMIPTGAIELPELLPEPVPGHAWVCRDGQAVAVSDRRGLVYDTKTGAEQQYTKLGELPEGLTTEPRPGPHHIWLNGWMLDESAQLAALQEAERTWRDSEIASVEWMRDRHRDQLEIGAPTTLTAGQYQELLQYMQALRDWPQSAEFPAQEYRPQPPEWLAGQLASAA